MHKTFVRREHVAGPRTTCRRCGGPIVELAEIGWVDVRSDGSFELCTADAYGDHQPVVDPVFVRNVMSASAHHR
jgi:hypothetical protein